LKLIELGPVENVLDVGLVDLIFTVSRRTVDWNFVLVDLGIDELGEALFVEDVFTLVQRNYFVFSQQLKADLALEFLQCLLLARFDHSSFFFILLLQLLD
jgi:hypothetical protein